MTTSSTPLRAVLIGLPHTHHSIPVEIRPRIAKGLAEVPAQMADAGIQYEFDAVTPEEGLAALGPKLQSQRPDAIIIGNGIRGVMPLTYFLEQIIDVVRVSAPEAKLLFNTTPEDTVDAFRRGFPTATKSA